MLYYKAFRNNESSDWVVLVHGAGGNSSIWFKQIREFINHFNVLIVDLRGHGKSKSLFSNLKHYNIIDVGKDILEVLNHLRIKSAHFVGISLGSTIIRMVSEIAPQRIKSMVLGGAIADFNFKSKLLMRIAHLIKRFTPYIWIYSIYATILMPKKNHRESRKKFIQTAYQVGKREFLKWMSLTVQYSFMLKIFKQKETHQPTLYLMGNEDHMFLPRIKQLVLTQKNAILKVIPDCGHVCNIDQPEVFNDYSLAFLRKNS